MADQIPYDIQEEIIKRLPVKSLLQFRSVCKAWKCLIDSPEFITGHSVTQPRHLLVTYEETGENVDHYVFFVDDNTFPQQRVVPIVPLSVKQLDNSSVVGCSQGLLCLHGYYLETDNCFSRVETAVLWNRSVRKSITVALPKKDKEFYKNNDAVLGFGVCPVTNDPKMVEIAQLMSFQKKRETSEHCKVQIYTLSSGKWRNLSGNLPNKSVRVTGNQVVIERFIYWSALHTTILDSGLRTHNMIMSFDLTNENFIVVNLPDCLASKTLSELSISISKFRDSLAMIEIRQDNGKYVNVVWMMEHGVQNSFTKLFTIKEPLGSMRTWGFRKSGEPIIEVASGFEYSCEQSALVVYEPNSDQFKNLEICGSIDMVVVNSYKETLLLLAQIDCSSY